MEGIIRQALEASWEIRNEGNSVTRSGSNTICLDELQGWNMPKGAVLAGLISTTRLQNRRVEIKNTNNYEVRIWIGDNHSHTSQPVPPKSTLIWNFKAIHTPVVNTQHRALISKDGREIGKFDVYGDDAPENSVNTFEV